MLVYYHAWEAQMPDTTPQTPEQTRQHFVEALRSDGRLLLRHLARRPDVSMPAQADGKPLDYSTLTNEPGAGADGQKELSALATLVDGLSRAAAPATIATIRLTSAYLRFSLDDGGASQSVKAAEAAAGRIRRRIATLIVMGIVATLAAVALLAYTNDGRRAIQQLQASRAEIASLDAQLARLGSSAWVVTRTPPAANGGAPDATPTSPPPPAPPAGNVTAPDATRVAQQAAFIPYCQESESNGPKRLPSASEEGAQAAALCEQRGQAQVRQHLVFVRLAEFNCLLRGIVTRWAYCPNQWAEPPTQASMADHWRRTEIRTTATISVLTGFVLPLLMGCVGGCAYALRRLDQKLSRWMLEAYDGTHALLRVLLASMLGGLLGVLWTGDEMVQLSGYTLSLAALAFFVGFSVEVVFSTIEALVDGVSARMRAPPPPGAPRT